MSTSRNNSQSGYLIILTMIVVFAMSAIALSIMATVSSKYATSARNLITENAVSAAEAGISDTVQQLNASSSFTGWTDTTNPRTFYDRGDSGKATYTTTVSAVAGDGTQTIESTGKVYRSATDPLANPATTKKVRAVVTRQQTPIGGSMVVGPGGLLMSESGKIPKSSGGIYVMGKIKSDQFSSIGTSSDPIEPINVANISCGTPWPQPCGAGSQPINLNDIFNSATIYGTVCATNQTDATRISNLLPNCTSPIIQSPVFDKKSLIAKIKAANPTPVTAASINSQCGSSFSPTITIPADTWITGNLTIDQGAFGSHCWLRFAGDTYIDGTLTIGSWGSLGVADSAGGTRPTIMVNRQIAASDAAVHSGNKAFAANASGTLGFLISFYSSNNSCSDSEVIPSLDTSTCLTPAQAKDSATLPAGFSPVTTYPGIACTGSGALIDFSGALFYAYYGIYDCASSKFNAVGGQGIVIRFSTSMTLLSSENSPFGQILTIPVFKAVDYQQVY